MDDQSVDRHLRLVWPQWQGAGTTSVRDLAPEFPFDVARRGYAVGTAVLTAILPAHGGRRPSYQSKWETSALRSVTVSRRSG